MCNDYSKFKDFLVQVTVSSRGRTHFENCIYCKFLCVIEKISTVLLISTVLVIIYYR